MFLNLHSVNRDQVDTITLWASFAYGTNTKTRSCSLVACKCSKTCRRIAATSIFSDQLWQFKSIVTLCVNILKLHLRSKTFLVLLSIQGKLHWEPQDVCLPLPSSKVSSKITRLNYDSKIPIIHKNSHINAEHPTISGKHVSQSEHLWPCLCLIAGPLTQPDIQPIQLSTPPPSNTHHNDYCKFSGWITIIVTTIGEASQIILQTSLDSTHDVDKWIGSEMFWILSTSEHLHSLFRNVAASARKDCT